MEPSFSRYSKTSVSDFSVWTISWRVTETKGTLFFVHKYLFSFLLDLISSDI
jgi:hypothetical protein